MPLLRAVAGGCTSSCMRDSPPNPYSHHSDPVVISLSIITPLYMYITNTAMKIKASEGYAPP